MSKPVSKSAGMAALIFTSWASTIGAATIVDFEDAVLPGGGVLQANGVDTTFFSHGAGFNAEWNEQFDCCPGGWAFSNLTDTTTAGFTNANSAIAGGGFGGSSQYGAAFEDPFGAVVPRITLRTGQRPESIRITNSTYAFLAIRDGNDGAGFVRQFGDDPGNGLGQGNEGFADFFKLTITGLDELAASTGSVEFYLADYRFADKADDYVVDDWRLVDLMSLGADTTQLQFNLETTDVGQFGANTPFYFAADELQLAAVPEPSSLALAAVALTFLLVVILLKRRRRPTWHRSRSN